MNSNRIGILLKFIWRHPGNRDRRVRAVGWCLIWQMWQRVVRRPLTIRTVDGLRMRCYPHSYAAALVLYCRLPEFQHMSFVRDFLRPGDCFVDVGANVGSYSLMAAATPSVSILAFEPATPSYMRLMENVAINGLGARVDVRQIAIGASAGEAKISTGKDALNHVVSSRADASYEIAPMETLDDEIPADKLSRVGLVKIDVEGFEQQVLQGASSLLATVGPVLIVEANDVAALRHLLEPFGYQAFGYDPSRRHLATIDWMDVHENNILAIRDRQEVEERLSSSTTARGVATSVATSTSTTTRDSEPDLDIPGGLDGIGPGASPSIGRSAVGMRGRVSWMVVDQGLSSLSNVGTSIIAARALSPRDFGAFGLAFVIYSLVIGLIRGAVTEPLVSVYSHERAESLEATLRSAAGSAVELAAVMALGVAAAAAFVGGVGWVALGGLALVLPGLMLQDAWRYAFVTTGRPRAAVLNDGLWCLIQAAALVVLLQRGHLTLLSVVLWWGASGAAAGVIGCVQAGMTPKFGSTKEWIREHRQLSWRYATEYGIATGTGQAALVLLGAIGGLAALGALRGGLVFFGPIVVLYAGAFLAIAAEGVRLRTEPVKLRRLMEYSSGALVLVALLSMLTGRFLPNHLGRSLFGATWPAAHRIIVPLGLAVLANCSAAGAVIGLRALAAAKASLRARLITAPLSAIGPVVGAAWGARGFAIGLAITAWIGTYVWWRQFRLTLAEEAAAMEAEIPSPSGG